MLASSPDRLPMPVLATLPGEVTARADVTVDPMRDLVTYTLSGFLDGNAVRAMQERQAQVLSKLHCGPNEHVTIIDISACKLQPQEVIEAFRGILADPRHQARRLAVVVGSSLARMQIRRVLHRDTVSYVTTLAEAEAWLFA